MNATLIRAMGLAATVGYAALIIWTYSQQPRSVAELTGGLASAVGAYAVDSAHFEEGRRLLRGDHLPEARAEFERADPGRRDSVTQFYVAYSYYRQGWGRLYNDDALFTQALAALDRATRLAPDGRVRVSDPELGLPDSDALRAELRHGLTIEPSDFNPLRVFRKRQ